MPRAKTQTNFWTPERDARLREMWEEMPRKQLIAMAEDFAISDSYVSSRAATLGLPRRNPKARSRAGEHRAPRAGKRKLDLEAAAIRAAAKRPAETTPCPYVDPAQPLDPETGRVRCCGVAVDRRMRNGARPGQYCKDHAVRVTPRGGDGTRAGARFLGPVTRAGVVGL